MAKFNWRHPLRSIEEIIFGAPEQPRQEPIQETPPPTPTGPDYFPPIGDDVPDNYEFTDYRHDIWGNVSGEAEYGSLADKAWELFENTGIPTGHGYEETNVAFEEFLRAFWLDTDRDGHIMRSQFYDDWDIVPDVIDWAEWREWRDTP